MENHGCVSKRSFDGKGNMINIYVYVLIYIQICVLQLAGLMERDMHYLAQLETYNNGKPLKDAVFDIYGAIYALKYYAGWADKIHGQSIPAGICICLCLLFCLLDIQG